MQGAYVYLVHRNIKGSTLRCTDLVGKVGKGTGKRTDAYRTSYGSGDLVIDTWNCGSDEEALSLEKLILDILEMKGWIRYHAPKNGRKANRSEVVSFPFVGKTPEKMIQEYMSNMRWIFSLISYYHSIMQTHLSQWEGILSFASSLHGKVTDGKILISDLPLFSVFCQSCTSKNMEMFFRYRIHISRKGDIITILNKGKEHKM